MSVLLIPAMVQAELGGSGSTAARDAAEQRAAVQRKLEKKRLKEEGAKKADVAQEVVAPAEEPAPADIQKEKPGGE